MLVLVGTAFLAVAQPAGDPQRGEALYSRCIACHSIERDRTGPRHEGLLGRRIGSVPGFDYSPALRRAGSAGRVWDEVTLDRFLESPLRMFPGTRMTYAGVKDAQERADLISYLKQAGATP